METERLFLKPITTDDAEFLFELYNSPHFLEFIGDRNIKNFEAAAEYIEARFLPQLERLGYGNYVIIRKADRQKIGAVGVYERKGLDVQDIGFSFLPQFEGQGYGFEAASKVLETVFNDYKVKKISAITSKANFTSQKLIKKLGLKYIKNVLLPGDTEELLYFEIENQTL
ncbi:GNAT family acetyltransferase [Kaistella solincola]|uniref:GNAT family acetyltransferase n=1 Tax=Kaistella solincola TaxID=510955 RepID=A0ABR4ZST4_9FLAO|nr:GNAT family N-acetyltransferase [Kaistella solincola]KIA84559.1 GNAT family acetyltransferase [Kaistella solincola]